MLDLTRLEFQVFQYEYFGLSPFFEMWQYRWRILVNACGFAKAVILDSRFKLKAIHFVIKGTPLIAYSLQMLVSCHKWFTTVILWYSVTLTTTGRGTRLFLANEASSLLLCRTDRSRPRAHTSNWKCFLARWSTVDRRSFESCCFDSDRKCSLSWGGRGFLACHWF